ncbi:MAG: transposase [Planctomycetota bacterium]
MPRQARIAPGGHAFHIINRSCRRSTLFFDDYDYSQFKTTLLAARDKFGTSILAYCIMPNHWHLVVIPREDGELAKFMHWLTMQHAHAWHEKHKTRGTGHVYQNRYKSILISDEEHLNIVCDYIENNPVRANLTTSKTEWRWSSAGDRFKPVP